MLPWNDLDEAKASEAQPPGQSACSTSTTVTVGQRAINSQSVRRTVSQSRPETTVKRRSTDLESRPDDPGNHTLTCYS